MTPDASRAWRRTRPNTLELHQRAGDAALCSLHASWGDWLARLWEAVAAVHVVLP